MYGIMYEEGESISMVDRGKMFACFRVNELHMSQAELASLSGVTVVTISKMEHGKTINNNVLLYLFDKGFYFNHCNNCSRWEEINDEASRRIKRNTTTN